MTAWEELELSKDEFDSLDLTWEENVGSKGEMVYEYYSYVPSHTPVEILERKGWKVGDLIQVSIGAFSSHYDDDDDLACSECGCYPCECRQISEDIQRAVDKDDRREQRHS